VNDLTTTTSRLPSSLKSPCAPIDTLALFVLLNVEMVVGGSNDKAPANALVVPAIVATSTINAISPFFISSLVSCSVCATATCNQIGHAAKIPISHRAKGMGMVIDGQNLVQNFLGVIQDIFSAR